MAVPSKAELDSLVAHQAAWSISIYMPAHRTGRDTRQDPIRLKNMVHQAEQRLIDLGLRPDDARKRLASMHTLLENSGLFWRHQEEGLAIFIGGNGPRLFSVPLELPELVAVGERFHVKPLLPLIRWGPRFFILALGQNSVRLFEAERYGIRQVPLPGVPENFAQSIRFVEEQPQVQFHTGTPRPSPGGERAAVFHGQGISTDKSDKKRLLEYCHAINTGVMKHLGEVHAPLVLAAAEPLLSLYAEANAYAGLYQSRLHGSPERLTPEELHVQATQLLAPLFDEDRVRDAALYHRFAGSRRASSDLGTVVRTAHDGQVDMLFVAVDEYRWGRFDAAAHAVEPHDPRQPGDVDLLDLAASDTYRHRGVVHAVPRRDMPEQSPLAAIFRYELPV